MGQIKIGSQSVTPIIVDTAVESISITPSTTAQTITPSSGHDGFSTISVGAVTSAIDSNITAGNIKKDVSILGVTGTYESASFSVINREVSDSGVYQMPANSFTFTLPSNATDMKSGALSHAFYECVGLTSADLSSLNTIGVSGSNAMDHAFNGCPHLISVDLSGLTSIQGYEALKNAFEGCTSLVSVDLSNLTTVSVGGGMTMAFAACSDLSSVDLSNLTTIYGEDAMECTFMLTGLTSVNFSSLSTLKGMYAMTGTFQYCSNLRSLSFPSLNSDSFDGDNYQFFQMLYGCSNVTVHFPSSLQSVIGSWSDVTSGFGGTNTTVLFDLVPVPALGGGSND